MQKRKNDYQKILNYIKTHKYAMRADIPSILQYSCSATIITTRINDLVKMNKIKKLKTKNGHVHYMLA